MPRRKKSEVEAVAANMNETIEQSEAGNKEPGKKSAAKAPKETVILQYAGKEFDVEKIKAAVKADYKGKIKGKVNILDIYIKPEDGAAYYVVNDISGKVEL